MSRATAICVGVLSLLVIGVFCYARRLAEAGQVNTNELSFLLLAMFLTAAGAAVFFAIVVLPRFGDFMGSFIANSDEKIEPEPHDRANALETIGNAKGAAEEYQRLANENPNDLFATNAATRLWCEKLQEPQRAVDFLQSLMTKNRATARDSNRAAYLANALADVYRKHLGAEQKAREVWEQFVEEFPDAPEAVAAKKQSNEKTHWFGDA